jgi:hypothetical protein
MTTSPAAIDTVVHDYLWRVQAALSTVPAPGRQEIVSELAEHIREAREDGAVATEADARNLVDRLGDPVEIAAEAHRRFGTLVRPTAGVREVAAVIFLSLGLLLPFLGWFVGVVLLWTSDAWNRRDKIIGTVLTSGGSHGSLSPRPRSIHRRTRVRQRPRDRRQSIVGRDGAGPSPGGIRSLRPSDRDRGLSPRSVAATSGAAILGVNVLQFIEGR